MTSSTNNESSFNKFCNNFAKYLGTLTIVLYAARETDLLTHTPARLTLISALGLATLPTIINTTPTLINKTCKKAQQAWSWCKKNPKQAIAISTTTTAMVAAGVGYYFYPEKCRQIFEKAKENFNRFNPNSVLTSSSTTGTTTQAAAFAGTTPVLDTAAELTQVPTLTAAAKNAAEQALDEVAREAANPIATMMEQATTVQIDPPQYDPTSELHDIEIPEHVIDAIKEFGSIIQQIFIAGLYDLQETALQTCLKTQELGERIVAELGEKNIQEALLQTPIF